MARLCYSLSRTVAPTAEPLSLSHVKQHLRLIHDDDDEELRRLIAASRIEIEKQVRRAYINQTWAMTLDAFPTDDYIELPVAPLSSVSSITYTDTLGASQTLATTVYAVDTAREPGCVALKYQQIWPTTRSEPNAVTITFVAGYGATDASVPQNAKHAMLLWIESKYLYRGVMEAPNKSAYDSLLIGECYGSYP